MSKIQISTFYPYPIELVWDALTDSDSMGQWLMKNDFKPSVGHKFQFRAQPQPGWRGIVDCEVLEVNKPNRLIYSWMGDIKKPKTVVTWTLTSEKNGTRLQLQHTGFVGVGGFILSQFILGPGWKKMLNKKLPKIVDAISKSGLGILKEKSVVQNCTT